MIEDVGLNGLVGDPIDRTREKIQLHRETRLGGLQLTDHQRHVAVDAHLLPQILRQIGTEHPEIGLVSSVHAPVVGSETARGVVLLDVSLAGLDIPLQQVELPVLFEDRKSTRLNSSPTSNSY